jgi:hypothetical protein|tara:strand:- start:20 stop:559 length:540 start_codon:yes stop_codon:yes gene_type:complete
MSKYYNPRIGAPSGTKPSAPTKKKGSKAKGGRGGPSKAVIAQTNQTKNKAKNTNPSKAKGGSKADIAKKNQEKNKSTQQGKNVSGPKNKAPQFDSAKGGGKTINTNPSKAKGGKGGPGKVKENKEPKSFNEAFKKARKEKGKDSTFTYKGKSYSTVTMDDVKAAGFDTLKEYLNNKKKK